MGLVLQLPLEPGLILPGYCTANTELHGDQEKFLGGYLYTNARECRPHTLYNQLILWKQRSLFGSAF